MDVFTTGMIKFENSVRASFQVGMTLGCITNSRYDRLYIHGSKGCIKSAAEYNQEGKIDYVVVSDGNFIERSVSAPNNYCMEIEQLNRCIKEEEKQHITKEFSIRNAKVMEDILVKIGYM